MTRKEVETLLGMTTLTMDNVLKGGHFPSFANTGVFSEEVMEWKRMCDKIRELNRVGDLSPPDCDDELDMPLL